MKVIYSLLIALHRKLSTVSETNAQSLAGNNATITWLLLHGWSCALIHVPQAINTEDYPTRKLKENSYQNVIINNKTLF